MKKRRRGGRGRTLSGYALENFWRQSLKTGTIMQVLKKMEKTGEYKGVQNILGGRKITYMVREEPLKKALKKEGLSDKDIQRHLSELLREGHVYSPKRGFYRRT